MKKEIRNGFIAAFSLLLFYFLVMTISSSSLSATVSQFKQLWYWMITLSLGFGIQVGLFTHLKIIINDNRIVNGAGAVTATSSGTSAASMVACCAHHLVETLPILGFSAAALFVSEYQEELLALGIVANLVGVGFMGWMIMGKPQPAIVANWALSKMARKQS